MGKGRENDLRRDRHTRSLLTDHMVFSPKFRGKVLVGEVRDAAEGSIRRICKDMGIQIIRMSVSADHVHLFYRYPPKYSASFIANMVKGRASRLLRKRYPHLRTWCKGSLWAPSCFHGSVGHGMDVVKKYISSQRDYSVRERVRGLKKSGRPEGIKRPCS